ncbi:MAG: hypothetical protein ACTHYV_04100 [Psychroflexus sp.]|uniref:hypothetical protein n=1 Tax=Psychroflexus sp. S27 TaxID=1982757 RepID=UPI000C2A5091|nr:hypothetical protein [Psychroflexus sp. S27]PJX26948.1 hypothetical protein CAP47_02010 [Psychroflexus sp. S27]
MKSKVGSKYSLLSVLVYCLAVTISSPVNQTADYSYFKDKKQEDRVSATSGNNFFHIAEFDTTLGFSNENLNENHFELSQNFISDFIAYENHLNANFLDYESRAVNLLIQQRKSDITYPFHCFW